MLRMIMTGSWHIPEWHIPEIKTSIPQGRYLFKACPPTANPSLTSRRPLANQLPTTRSQSPINRQPVPDWSLTGRRFLWTVPAKPVPYWTAIDCRLICNWKNCGIDRTAVELVADVFGGKAVVDMLQFIWPGLKTRQMVVTTYVQVLTRNESRHSNLCGMTCNFYRTSVNLGQFNDELWRQKAFNDYRELHI